MKLWGGRFDGETDKGVLEFLDSLEFDKELAGEDVKVNLAYAKALNKAGLLDGEELAALENALEEIAYEICSGNFAFKESDEDVHTAVERALIEKAGETAKKIHAGRSRNEQVVADEKLYLKKALTLIEERLKEIQKTLLDAAVKNKSVYMAGLTHFQPAQPVLFSHHLLAYFWMFNRDRERLKDCLCRVDISPLGVGALAGNALGLDRRLLAKELGFKEISENSLETVSDRDYILEFLADCLQIMLHLSRLAEEIVIWSNPAFGYIELSDSHTTGSSLMPQKKNPDVAEVVRGKTGRVAGGFTSLSMVMKGLPLSYNRDLQEDKEPLFDATVTVSQSLGMMSGLVKHMKIDIDKLRESAEAGFICATDLADYLVLKGVPFHDAHRIAGEVVKYCLSKKKKLEELSLDKFKEFSTGFTEDLFTFIDLENSLKRRDVPGGTAPKALAEQIKKARKIVNS